jgi:hypothetical protein
LDIHERIISVTIYGEGNFDYDESMWLAIINSIEVTWK